MKQGDVCLVHFPFTDGTSSKVRPVLVVSNSAFNTREDVTVVPISSAPASSDPDSIFIDEPDFAKAGLKKKSSIKFTKPATISKSVFVRKLGALPDSILRDAVRKLSEIFKAE